MTRTRIAAALMLGTCLAAGTVWADNIPLNSVVLSTSGLAQFERKAQVNGNTTLEFPARLDQVDDILKSLVVFDKDGKLGGVTLPGKQPLEQIFKDLPFDRKHLSSSMMLLNAYQGASVTIKGAELTATGKIIQVTPETVAINDNRTVTKHRISLMTDEGIKQAILEDLQSLQFTDPKAQAEITRALDAIRENSKSDSRTLTVNLQGSKARDVTLSYVVPAPLWKTAYRLVMPEAGKTKGFLQGWAIIENMTAEDWNKVDLSLISGNPVTFHQALYPSYYVTRPEIPVQVFGLALPRIDEGGMAAADAVAPAPATPMLQKAMRARAENFAGAAAGAPMMAMEADEVVADQAVSSEDIANTAQAAQGGEAATQVLFRFPDRFSLKAGQSMMLPFVSREIPMQRVFVYQPDTNARHPLAALELQNDGETGLPPGILTMYEENKLLQSPGFVGDAQLAVMGQGEKRFVSYALDNKTTIDREDKSAATEGQISVDGGIMRIATQQRLETVYTIKAPSKEDRAIIIEHPRMGGDYKLVTPDPKEVEMTESHYRIKVDMRAGETQYRNVVLESTLWQSYTIADMPLDMLVGYASNRGTLSDAVRATFADLAKTKREIDALQRRIDALEQKREIIFQDQERLRQNLQSLEGKSEVQQKYLDKLNAQEDEVAKINQESQSLTEQRDQKVEELQAKIAALKF